MTAEKVRSRHKKTILLVEDESITARAEAVILEKGGYDVIIAPTGMEAIDTVNSGRAIDLILMDIDLGEGMDGTETAEIILRGHAIPVIFLSSHTDPETVQKTEKISSYGYVVKNTGDTVLFASIAIAFRLHSARMEMRRHEEMLNTVLEERTLANKKLQSANDELVRSNLVIIEREKALMDNVPDMISRHTPDGRVLFISPSSEILLGYSPDELTGQAPNMVIPRESIDDIWKVITEALKTRRDRCRAEHPMIRKDGRKIWVETQSRFLFDEKGDLTEMQCVARDITERKEIESQKEAVVEALRQSEEKFRGIAEQLRDTIFITDTMGTITYMSPSARVLFGCNPDDMTGRHFMENLDETSIPLALEKFGQSLESLSPQKSILLTMKRKDGTLFQGELVATILKKDSMPVGTLGLIRDTTERKNGEEALARALDEKESLLRELQHRVKNSFAIVAGIVELEGARRDDGAVQDVLMEIRNRVVSLADLYDILNDSQEVKEIRLDLYLERMSRSIVNSYLSELRGVELFTSMDPVLIDVKRAISLGLMANELITNAVKYAFPDGRGGRINIRLQNNKNLLVLEVTDNGVGMPEGTDMDTPSGLGLELVRMLAVQLKGLVRYEKTEDTLFRVTFPYDDSLIDN